MHSSDIDYVVLVLGQETPEGTQGGGGYQDTEQGVVHLDTGPGSGSRMCSVDTALSPGT